MGRTTPSKPPAPFTEETALAYFMRYYTEKGFAWVAAKLGRAYATKLRRKTGTRARPSWTRKEMQELEMLWSENAITTIAKHFGRTELAVKEKAKSMGLALGAPRGWEYVTACARRLGFSTVLFRKIMRAHGVNMRFSMAPRGGTTVRNPRRKYIVDSGRAEDAVEEWLALEPYSMAAARHKVAPSTLRLWLKEDGRIEVPRYKKYSRWRVPSDLVDEVVAKAKARTKYDIAARREETKKRLLAKKGKWAGYVPFGYKVEGHKLRKNEDEQAAMARVFALRAEGLSLMKILRKVEAEGYKPRGKRWHLNTIWRLCTGKAGVVAERHRT